MDFNGPNRRAAFVRGGRCRAAPAAAGYDRSRMLPFDAPGRRRGAGPALRSPAAALGRLALPYPLILLPAGALGLPRTLLGAGVLAALQTGLLLLIVSRDRSRDRIPWRPRWRDAAEAAAIAAGLLAALALLTLLAGALPETAREALLRGYRWELADAALLPAALLFVLASAYREELYFRAYFLTVLAETATPAWLAVLASALLFGAGHLYQGWLAAGGALLAGIAFALLYLQRPGLHRLAWAHAAFNLTVLLLGGALFTD